MNNKLIWLLLTLCVIVSPSCDKDKEKEADPVDQPYNLEIPAHFSQNYDKTAPGTAAGRAAGF